MSKVKGKYLKDENGEIFSPITHMDCIVAGGRLSLKEYLKPKILFSGDIRASNDTWVDVKCTESFTNYNYIDVILGASLSESIMITFPVILGSLIRQPYECKALHNYYAIGLIRIKEDNISISFNCRLKEGWPNVAVFRVLGRH